MGLAYADGGRTAAAVDCWGLVRLIFAERLGINLPAYDSSDDVALQIKTAQDTPEWTKFPEAKEFDIVTMLGPVKMKDKWHMIDRHVGVMATTKHVLHIDRNMTSTCLDLNHPLIRHRLSGFWRHRSML